MDQKHTIMHLIDTTGPGGAETIFTQLADTTHRLGCETIAVIRGSGWVADELRRLNIRTYLIDCKGSFNVKFLTSLLKLIRQENVLLIQSHLLGSNVYASLAGLLTGTPVFSTFHGYVDISPNERFRFLKFLLISLGSKKVIAVTTQMKSALQKTFGLNSNKIDVIPNGVDTSFFNRGSAAPIREELGIPSEATIIGCLGNVRKAKNYNLAIDTIAELKRQNFIAYLLIAGDDKNALAESHRKYAEEKGVSDFVKWLGFYQDTPGYLNSLDIFLLSSSTEGHPLALTQAMSVGVPVVATKCGVEEILKHEYNAMLAEVGDSASLAINIQRLTNDPILRTSIIKNALTKITNELSIEVMCKKYIAYYTPYIMSETA